MSTEINTEHNEHVEIPRADDLAAQMKEQQEKQSVGGFKFKTANENAMTGKQKQELIDKGVIAGMEALKVKPKATTIDWANIKEDDIYDTNIPIQARPFDTEDSLKVVLKDATYIARWVNKNPMRLGTMIARGFQYVESKDLAERLQVEVSADAEDHYIINDVVLMKISKERYFSALKAAQLRAQAAVDPRGAHKAALNQASEFLNKETGGQYANEAKLNKVKFYSPEVEI